MKRFFKIALAVAVALPVFASCNKENGGETKTAVTGVSLDKTSIEFVAGQNLSVSLTATVAPENATEKGVTWTVADPEVATISATEGATIDVSGGKVGETTITVTTKDGGFTAKCDVVVKSADVPVEFVLLDTTKLNLIVDGEATLVATVYPEDATNKEVTWSSSDPAVATVSETGVVTGVSDGVATVTVTTVDGGKTADCSVRVGGLPKIELAEEYFSTNAPMEYVAQGIGADEYGFKGAPDWFNPLEESQIIARTNTFGLFSNMWDDDDATCFHTNLDWGALNTSWGYREGAAPGPFTSAYLKISLPDDYTTVQLKVKANTNESGSCFSKKWGHGGQEFSCDGFLLYWSADGDEFVLYEDETIEGGKVECVGFGGEAEVTLTATEAMPVIAALKIVGQMNPKDEDPDGANDWNGINNAFGIAEMEIHAE